MRALDEDALFCDFAEFYHIYDWDSLTIEKQAVLACGLPPRSRIMKQLAKMDHDLDTILLAAILDQERVSNWRHTKDAKRKQNFPKSIVEALTSKPKGEEEKKDEVRTFDSGEEFKKTYERLAGRG